MLDVDAGLGGRVGPELARLGPSRSSAPPSYDPKHLFRELCLLCGLPLVVSIVYTVAVKIGGLSALGAALASFAMATISLGGALFNRRLVGSALHLPTSRDWLATLILAVVAAPVLSGAFWLLQLLGFSMRAVYLAPYLQAGWPAWVGYADVALVTPMSEELLYRGLVQPKLGQALTSTEALIVQAALFSAAHLSPVILVTHFGMGLVLGWVRRRSGSLLPSILLHGSWNAWVVWSSSTSS